MILQFFVQGLPKPAGSKRAFPIFRGSGPSKQFVRAVVTDACATSKDWKTTVAWEAKSRWGGGPLIDGAIRLELRFVLPRAKGHYGSGKNRSKLKESSPKRHLSKPDVLKLARAVEDALTGVVWLDDSQIVEEYLEKRYAGMADPALGIRELPGVNITINHPNFL